MTISDAVVGNLTTLYLVVIVAIKAIGTVTGRNFSGIFVLITSSIVVGAIVIVTLTWDVSRKAAHALATATSPADQDSDGQHEMCRGGICWHGVAVKAPASQVRFRLPQHQPPPENDHPY